MRVHQEFTPGFPISDVGVPTEQPKSSLSWGPRGRVTDCCYVVFHSSLSQTFLSMEEGMYSKLGVLNGVVLTGMAHRGLRLMQVRSCVVQVPRLKIVGY